MKLPAHMRIQLSAFVRSDKREATAEVKVGGCVDTELFTGDNLKLEEFTKAACDSINAALDTDDARPVTAEELQEYLAEMQADERAAGRISESARISDLPDDEE